MTTPSSPASRRRSIGGLRMWFVITLVILALGRAEAQDVIPPDRDGLLKGIGLDLAAVAELNNWPGPKHVLALKTELGLTRDQLKKTEAVEKGVVSSATAKGEEIVQLEEELAVMFQSGSANEKAVRTKLEQIGKARAELRYIHLQAHLRMKQILTPDQVKLYVELKTREIKREN